MHHLKSKQIQLSTISLFPYAHNKFIQAHEYGYDPVCDWIIKNKMIYEHYVLMMLAPVLRECSYLVDIGCHIGTYTYAKQLAGNFNSTLSIDASRENIELARINLIDQNNFDSMHGFWIDKNVCESHTLLANEFKGKGHDKLHGSITNNPANSFKIPNIRTSTISNWINEHQHNAEPGTQLGFVKIDIDGSEENTSQELCASLICTKAPFIMLIETGNPKVIESLTDLGMKIMALLPGNNFLLCCPNINASHNSVFCIHQILSLTVGYLNMVIKDDSFLMHTNTIRDNKLIRISTPFGDLTAESSIMSNSWKEHLSGYDFPVFCYG